MVHKKYAFELLENEIGTLYEDLAARSYSRLKQAGVQKVLQRVIKNELTASQKQVLMLYYDRKHTMQEIADTLHINKSTVSRTHARALAKIRRIAGYSFYMAGGTYDEQ